METKKRGAGACGAILAKKRMEDGKFGERDESLRSGGGWCCGGRWEGSERLYGAVREKSIDFRKILYRLFYDTSVQTLVQHGSNDKIVWDNRPVPIVELLLPFGRKGRERTWVA